MIFRAAVDYPQVRRRSGRRRQFKPPIAEICEGCQTWIDPLDLKTLTDHLWMAAVWIRLPRFNLGSRLAASEKADRLL